MLIKQLLKNNYKQKYYHGSIYFDITCNRLNDFSSDETVELIFIFVEEVFNQAL